MEVEQTLLSLILTHVYVTRSGQLSLVALSACGVEHMALTKLKFR